MDAFCYDLCVIGGGIQGTAIARDAAGRGLSVLLLEQGDFAGATSSASSKLIHGGLRYLEHGEFRLVREALSERAVLAHTAAHLVHSQAFVLPHTAGMRAPWLMKLGLFFYDHLGRQRLLPKSQRLNLRTHPAGQALAPAYQTGFLYYDCATDDARLVIANAQDARNRGAELQTNTAVTHISHDQTQFIITAEQAGNETTYHARGIVNAAGPWVNDVTTLVFPKAPLPIKWVKGSHFIIKRPWQHDYAYTFQHNDGRIIFALPYAKDTLLIGTTDVPLATLPTQPLGMSDEEQTYLLELLNQYLATPINSSKILGSFAGTRTLIDTAEDATKTSRDYTLDLQVTEQGLPFLSIYGGKLTTHRIMAEQALTQLKPFYSDMKASWTARAPLPGSDFNGQVPADYYQSLRTRYPQFPSALLERWFQQFGSRCETLLAPINTLSDLGKSYGHDLYQHEIDYLKEYEWLSSMDGLLQRCTHLGLQFSQLEQQTLGAELADMLK